MTANRHIRRIDLMLSFLRDLISFNDRRADSLESAFAALDQSTLVALTHFSDTTNKFGRSEHFGDLLQYGTRSIDVSTPTTLTSFGMGRVGLRVDPSSTDIDGDIILTGTTVDPNTGVETPADTETISLGNVGTTSNTITDVDGNTVHRYENLYISDKTFRDQVVISSAAAPDDVDIAVLVPFQLGLESFNFANKATLLTFEVNVETKNALAWLHAYLYRAKRTHPSYKRYTYDDIAGVHIDSGTALADRFWGLRRGGLAEEIDPMTDGIFVDVYTGNSASYYEDLGVLVWAEVQRAATVALAGVGTAPSTPTGGGKGGGGGVPTT